MFGNVLRLVCVLFLIIAFAGLFAVTPVQAQNNPPNPNSDQGKDIPEPMTLTLLGLGLAGGLAGIGFRKRK
jgi:hypothetical protein